MVLMAPPLPPSGGSNNNDKKYLVQVVIENKPYINDPEGETIHRDLIVKGGYSAVRSVRSAKMLKMAVSAASEKEAERLVQKLCEELRIFNPVVSNCTVKAVAS
jgi:phosphoribosylformylglycinamidine synthase